MDRRDALKAVGALGLASVENVLPPGEQRTKPDALPSPRPGDQAGGTKAGGTALSNAPQLRRKEKLMPEDHAREMISQAFCGRLATVSPDGSPYIVPLLYVWMNGEIWIHSGHGRGHFRSNVEHEQRVCFEVDDPGEVYANGPSECNTSLAYRSVVAFGRVRIIEDQQQKKAFCDALMKKYADPKWDRPKGVYPRLDQVSVWAIAVERMTGKETPLPAVQDRWPAADKTKKPDAVR